MPNKKSSKAKKTPPKKNNGSETTAPLQKTETESEKPPT